MAGITCYGLSSQSVLRLGSESSKSLLVMKGKQRGIRGIWKKLSTHGNGIWCVRKKKKRNWETMAGITCYGLSSQSVLRLGSESSKSLLVMKGKQRGIRGFQIKAQVEFVNAEEAKKLVGVEGYAVVDVRDKTQFERAHIKNCYHVPLFIENTDNDIGTIVKRQLHNNFAGLFFGLPFTKANPEFVQSVKSQFSPESKLLLVCQEGLRSAAAAERLERAGYDNIACITSGLQTVKPGTFDSVGSKELQDAGKAGLVTIQGKISAVLGTVLICALLFVTFFPDQAEQILQMAPSS